MSRAPCPFNAKSFPGLAGGEVLLTLRLQITASSCFRHLRVPLLGTYCLLFMKVTRLGASSSV